MTGASGGMSKFVSWTVAGGFAAWAVVRLTGADRQRQLERVCVPPVAFTPWAAAAAPPAALILGLTRRKRAALTVALAGAALASTVASRALRHRQPAAQGPVLRILTANILVGRADADELVRLARRTQADVLFLQEVTEDAVTRLKQAGLDELLPHTVIDARDGLARGSAIYAQQPLGEGRVLEPATHAQPTARLKLPGGQAVDLVCAHPRAPLPPLLSGAGPWRHELSKLPPADSTPRILAGDFNATLDHGQLRSLLGLGYVDAAATTGNGLVPTWGLERGPGLLTIDHVLVDRRCAVLATAVHDLPGSDHRAVYAEVRLP